MLGRALVFSVLLPSMAGAQPAWSEEVVVPSAAFQVEGAPSAVVHAPAGFDPQSTFRVVVYLHGWTGCARVLAGAGEVRCRTGDPVQQGWDLAGAHDASRSDALLVIPQLAFWARNGRPGAFAERGRFARFMQETLQALSARGIRPENRGTISLFAHSAGYETALALVANGGAPIEHVVLFDALYRGYQPFGEWARGSPSRRLISVHGHGGRTDRQSQLLVGWARRNRVEVGPRTQVALIPTEVSHREIPARLWGEVVRALGLTR